VPVLKPAPKIFKEDMLIRWDDTAENIYNKIRGLSPYPAAFTRLSCLPQSADEPEKTLSLKIYSCSISKQESTDKPGKITIENDKKMRISTKNFEIHLENLQLEGKKRMGIEDFLKGFRKEYYTNYLK
jgi:methionyl-tRNA formyltransferase